MTNTIKELETRRGILQSDLDEQKTSTERNRLGQFATPMQLAIDVVTYGLSLLSKTTAIHFLDPAIGTGAFYSALLASAEGRAIKSARGFEVDPHYGDPAKELWKETPLSITLGDFTTQDAPTEESKKANLLICNPPYVRHHHISGPDKARLHTTAVKLAATNLSGLSGLYCYFLAISHAWMQEGGVAGWLIPSEFMDVNYGRAVKDYLLRDVTLLHIHRFDPNDVQFDDALVSSAVVWFKKAKPSADHRVTFSFGGTMHAPAIVKDIRTSDLQQNDKWTQFPRASVAKVHDGYRLSDLFLIKRGLATGDNKFFILDEEHAVKLNLPRRFLRPVLPSARYIKADEIKSDEEGVPLLEKRLFLIDCDLPENKIVREYPALWEYLQNGAATVSSGYLCRSRRLWYAQEKRPPAPIVCTYLGRSDRESRPFRFLLNNSNATATNVYLLLYPKARLADKIMSKPDLLRRIWKTLNSIRPEILLGNGRVYGGGLHKLEPRELGNIPADELAQIAGLGSKTNIQQSLPLEEVG